MQLNVLGLDIDVQLSFTCHVDKVCKKLSKRIGILNKIKFCLPLKQRIIFYNAMIKPVITYANVVWHNCSSKDNLHKVLRLQKRAARVILNAEPRSPSVQLFNRLGWVPFYIESRIAQCTLAYKRSWGMVPSYLKDCLKKISEYHSRSTRYCNLNFLCPNVKRKTEGGRTFAVSTCIQWNSLPIKTKREPTVKTFSKTVLTEALNEQKYLSHVNP